MPTVAEQGVSGYDVSSWNAIFAPAGTPPEVVGKLNATLVEVLADPSIQQRFAELGVEARSSTPDEIGQRLADDLASRLHGIQLARGAGVDALTAASKSHAYLPSASIARALISSTVPSALMEMMASP